MRQKPLRDLVHHLVVHRAAAGRQRVRQHDGHAGLLVEIGVEADLARGLGADRADVAVEGGVVHERLEPPGGARDVERHGTSVPCWPAEYPSRGAAGRRMPAPMRSKMHS